MDCVNTGIMWPLSQLMKYVVFVCLDRFQIYKALQFTPPVVELLEAGSYELGKNITLK
jgi:hypothetical protein